MKNEDDKSALIAFKQIHKQIPDIKSVRTDNGSEFISTIFKDYLKENNIDRFFRCWKAIFEWSN